LWLLSANRIARSYQNQFRIRTYSFEIRFPLLYSKNNDYNILYTSIVIWMHSFPLIFFRLYIATTKNYEIIHANTRYCTLLSHDGTARFVVYCAKYRVVEYYRVCRFIDVILEYVISHIGRWLLHGSVRVIYLQSSFKKCAISRICVYYFIVLSCCYIKPKKDQRKRLHSYYNGCI
jgi:hypothetical protein